MLQLHIQSPLLIILHDQLLIAVSEINLLQAWISTLIPMNFPSLYRMQIPPLFRLMGMRSGWPDLQTQIKKSVEKSDLEKSKSDEGARGVENQIFRFRENWKELAHWPFRQQTKKQPEVSPEVILWVYKFRPVIDSFHSQQLTIDHANYQQWRLNMDCNTKLY